MRYNLGEDMLGVGELANYPHLFPPPGFTPFVRTGLLTAPAVAQSNLLETIQLTATMEGWVRLIGLEAGDFSVITFQIQSGGAPLRDYTGVNVPLGNVATPMSVFIPMPVNAPLQLFAISTGLNPQPVRWLLSGWYYDANRRP